MTLHTSPRAFIAGCSGLTLTSEERAFFRDADPWALILFKRNIADPAQVLALTSDFRSVVGRTDAPVLIDQEGGRVQRMGPPHWRKMPPGRRYGEIADPIIRREITRLGARMIAHDLRAVGITCDCVPVLDVPQPGAHDIIGDRAYAMDPATIAVLGRAAAEGLLAGGVLPVIKHIPGHGRAFSDSHEALPVVDASLEDLRASDFVPFKALTDMPLAMTAHVVYTAIDPSAPVTTSRLAMDTIIRGEIGYDGLVMSDDLSMKALSGAMRDRTEAAFVAGCDMALHCNGQMDEMRAVAEASPLLSGRALLRAEMALSRITHTLEPFDPVDAAARFEAVMAATLAVAV